MLANDGILGGRTSVERGSILPVDDPLMAGHPATDACVINRGILGESKWLGWRAAGGVGYLDQDIAGIGLTRRADEALILDTDIAQQGIASIPLLDSALVAAQRPDVALFSGALTQACETCGSVHVLAGPCPFEVTSHLCQTYQGDVLNGLVPERGSFLQCEGSLMAISQQAQGIMKMDQAAIYPSDVGIYESAVLPNHGWATSVLERPDIAFVNDGNMLGCATCGSFHVGRLCPSEVALAPYVLQPSNVLHEWLLQERESFSEVLIPSWKSWPTVPAYIDTELGDYLAARVGNAIYDAVERHSLVNGDLIVQVVVVVQAETGAITQIGRISSN